MWQVSISTTAGRRRGGGADCWSGLFQSRLPVYCDEETGAIDHHVLPETIARLAPRAVRARCGGALRPIAAMRAGFGPGRITIKPLPRQNWAESWKRHFKPVEIGGFLLIKPSWSRRRARPGQRVIILDPGLELRHRPSSHHLLLPGTTGPLPPARRKTVVFGHRLRLGHPGHRRRQAWLPPRSSRSIATRKRSASAARTSRGTGSGPSVWRRGRPGPAAAVGPAAV